MKINWEHKRAKHMIERMWLRGVSREEVKQAILSGQKRKQKETGLMESLFSFYSVVYDEHVYLREKIRKVFPVTVKMW
ncbi:MAG: hypothetical protein Q8N60_04310 [Candidatus Diapherotrites archaeon]|nr:hypothetical protein [Candidatus Diapherotrites archaeon]